MKSFQQWMQNKKNESIENSIINQKVNVRGFRGEPERQAIILKVLPSSDVADLGFLVKYLDNGETKEVSSYFIPSVFSPPLRRMIANYLVN